MDSAAIVVAFKEEMERAGLKPRDVSPLVGLSHTTLYRILTGRAITSKLALRSMQMFTKFLKNLKPQDNDGVPSSEYVNDVFEQWLVEKF